MELLLVLVAGLVIGLALGLPNPDAMETLSKANKELAACESHIPRDEGCHIIAVPSKEYPKIIR